MIMPLSYGLDNPSSRVLLLSKNVPTRQEGEFQTFLYQECSAIKPIVVSAAEYKTLTFFLTCQTTIALQITIKNGFAIFL